VSISVYILSKCSSKRLKGVISKEVWSNNKRGVGHQKVFGSICYKHVFEQLRK